VISDPVNSVWETALTALAAFVGTNVDDLVVLTVFFAQRTETFRSRSIVVGQYLGFTVLLVISALGTAGGVLLPREWVGLLGFAPIYMGIRHAFQRNREGESAEGTGINPALERHPLLRSRWSFVLSPASYSVAAVTLANGGDNVSVYVPIFASAPASSMFLIFAVFYLLIAVWCLAAARLANHPLMARLIQRHGRWVVPCFLIGLGIFILWENNSLSLMRW